MIRNKAESPYPDDCPPVTVIIPAYNEQKVIGRTIHSVLATSYTGHLRVLVVDDGSQDNTAEEVKREFYGNAQVELLRKPNGGKWSALNYAYQRVLTEIVVCIDADTQLAPDAIGLMCRHFADPEVGAVAGNPKVGNRVNMITRIQAYEYVALYNVERQAMEMMDAITCVAGAVGAYRKSLVWNLGGYLPDTLIEDTELTLRIQRSGAKVVYEEDAIGWTEAPETAGDFLKQRFRWMYGHLQAAFKHRDALFNSRYGGLGLFALPLMVFNLVVNILLVPLLHLVFWVGLMPGAWKESHLPLFHYLTSTIARQGWSSLLTIVLTLSALAVATLALVHDRKERLLSILWFLPMHLLFWVLLSISAFKCIGRLLSGRSTSWGYLTRTGNVNLPLIATVTAEQIDLDRFEIEQFEKVIGGEHEGLGGRCAMGK